MTTFIRCDFRGVQAFSVWYHGVAPPLGAATPRSPHEPASHEPHKKPEAEPPES